MQHVELRVNFDSFSTAADLEGIQIRASEFSTKQKSHAKFRSIHTVSELRVLGFQLFHGRSVRRWLSWDGLWLAFWMCIL